MVAFAGEMQGIRHCAEFVVTIHQSAAIGVEVLDLFGESGDIVGCPAVDALLQLDGLPTTPEPGKVSAK